MDRRKFLNWGAATLGATALAKRASAQGAPATARASAPPPDPSGRFPLDVFSRSLQWLRSPGDVAKAVSDIGLQSLDLTVMPYPGHVDPAKVKTELPLFVSGLKQSGISVSAVTCPITDADSPNAEAILGTASSLGIRYYSWGSFRYDDRQPYQPQLDALKPRVSKLAKLNEKYGMKALYQPQAGAGNVGAAFFDFLEVLRNFDPRFVSFRYDTGSLLQATPQTFVVHMRLGAPYIGGLALNDATVTLDLPVWKDGPFVGKPQDLIGVNSSSGDNVGKDGGSPLAIGGGGRPLPYHLHQVPVGTGMIDLSLIGKILKEINFRGPAECQAEWPLGGAEQGNDKITLPRQTVIGQIKHNRLMVEAAFASTWDLDIMQPAFMNRRGAGGGRRPDAGNEPE